MKKLIMSCICSFVLQILLPLAGLAQIPDIGGRVVFASNRDGVANLYIIDLTNQEIRKITEFPGDIGITFIYSPHWSKDGKRILFSGVTPELWYQIYVINDDGTDLRRLTEYSLYSEYCDWDPLDNTYFYCLQTLGWGNESFHRVNIDTLADTTIPMSPDFAERGTSGNDGFAITPDGTQILFTRNNFYQSAYLGYQDMQGLASSIFADSLPRMEIDDINPLDGWLLYSTSQYFPAFDPLNMAKRDKTGSMIVMLTKGTGGERNELGSWAGGGNQSYIVFTSNHYGNSEIVLMKADGNSYPSGMVNLTNNPSGDWCPDWTPIGWVQKVDIDILPGKFPNDINSIAMANIPVAVFSSATFDATTIDPMTVTLADSTVRLRGNGTPMYTIEDVNEDGRLDMVIQVTARAMNLSETDVTAVLRGKTTSRITIEGQDSIMIK